MSARENAARVGAVCRVAIDGPAGAGKSTVAKAVASRLSALYIDTGAMYRAVGLKMLAEGIGTGPEDAERLAHMLAETEIDFADGRICLDGRDVSGDIRTDAISRMASECSALPSVRQKLVALQRAMGERRSVLMDGRDIGSNVFPDAEFKFFLTASPQERAHRRFLELQKRDENVSLARVLEDIEQRDYNDSHRALHPLVKTADAYEIDSTNMSAEEVTERVLAVILGARTAEAERGKR
ncbi:MAG: (d)CMP kinase [Clostridiales Family XIII bacterium]|jgi:cytidylate kinase|nr:(d)CMP kinase [Clostridiales Family XIII bacterium]